MIIEEWLEQRKAYLEKQISLLRTKLELLEKEVEDIEFVEDTIEAEKRICICRKCKGEGVYLEIGEKEGTGHTKKCELCGGTGYTAGEEKT